MKLTSFAKEEIERRVKTHGFRLLLDGQQRATAIYRALKGVDAVYFIIKLEDELSPEVREIPVGKRSLEQVLYEFSGESRKGFINIKLSDVYETLGGEYAREKDKADLFLKSSKIDGIDLSNVSDCYEFTLYLTHLKNLENLLRQEKLVAYYLLDTDEEKFALFFERSNSKGMQLNFIDILAAKLYRGFNLREHIETFSDDNPTLRLQREVMVRAISYAVSRGKDTSRAYILGNLTAEHFVEHWEQFVDCYKKSYEYLTQNNFLIHPDWIPYDNMLIPIMTFLRQIHRCDFSQINEKQARIINAWYWLAIFSRRYSSAAQTYVLEDAQMLERVAQGDYSSAAPLLQRTHSLISVPEDLLAIHKKYDALYKGILNFCNFLSGGFRDLQNGNRIIQSSSLEDHHIFPKDYLKRNGGNLEGIDNQVLVDCVVNRTLVPKITNIKIANKAPSIYIGELSRKNSNIKSALASHLIPEEVLSGAYDADYQKFIDARAMKIVEGVKKIIADRDLLTDELRRQPI